MKYIFSIFLIIHALSWGTDLSNIKIGVYSGTFDPPTLAHNAIIHGVLESLKLDKLYIFVNKNGDKFYKCSGLQRVEMLERMLADVSDHVVIIDQSSDKKYQDYLMIKKIIKDPIINITGQDSYERRLKIVPDKRIGFDAIAIIPRGDNHDLAIEHNAFFLNIETSHLRNISSTEVRKRLGDRDYAGIALHDSVLSYIIEHGLYENAPHQQEYYEHAYYAYVGKILCTCPPPPFDPQASPKAWPENFYRWFIVNTEVKV